MTDLSKWREELGNLPYEEVGTEDKLAVEKYVEALLNRVIDEVERWPTTHDLRKTLGIQEP